MFGEAWLLVDAASEMARRASRFASTAFRVANGASGWSMGALDLEIGTCGRAVGAVPGAVVAFTLVNRALGDGDGGLAVRMAGWGGAGASFFGGDRASGGGDRVLLGSC